MPVSLERVYEELRDLPPEKLEIVASVIRAFSLEAQSETIHPEWEAVLDRRSGEVANGQVDLIDAEDVDAYIDRALGNAD